MHIKSKITPARNHYNWSFFFITLSTLDALLLLLLFYKETISIDTKVWTIISDVTILASFAMGDFNLWDSRMAAVRKFWSTSLIK